MKIAITGSTGFVGRNLVPYLSKTFNIIKYDREFLNADTITIDSDISHVIHMAGKAHDLKKNSNINDYIQANFELTKVLFDAFLISEATSFIYISSVKAAADSVDGILKEEISASPKTDYGKSKLLAENYILAQTIPRGKKYFILRPCMIHGPGNKGNLNLLYKFILRRLPYPLAAFENRRSFLSIENLCFVINQLLVKTNIKSGIYNVADNEPLSSNDVVKILASSLGTKAILWRVPVVAVNALAQIGDLLKLPLNSERLIKLTESYIVSNQKLLDALSEPLPISAEEGLKYTASSFHKE